MTRRKPKFEGPDQELEQRVAGCIFQPGSANKELEPSPIPFHTINGRSIESIIKHMDLKVSCRRDGLAGHKLSNLVTLVYDEI